MQRIAKSTAGGDSFIEDDIPLEKLRFQRFPLRGQPTKPAIVLLHGWGSGSWVWQPVLDKLAQDLDVWMLDLPGYGINSGVRASTVEQFVCEFGDSLDQLPRRFALVGWSLGGLLASFLTKKYSDRVSSLILVATSPSFVSRSGGGSGMAPSIFGKFLQGFEEDSARLLKRFSVLQSRGGERSSQCLRFLQNEAGPIDSEALAFGLQWLSDTTLYNVWSSLDVPVMTIYGKHDSLVDVKTASLVQQEYPNHKVFVFDDSAHLPFFDEPEQFVSLVNQFANEHVCNADALSAAVEKPIDVPAVQRAFSRAASNYDRRANVQHRVARDLVELLGSEIYCCSNNESPVVVDLGSGTGFLSRSLKTPLDSFIQLDISEPMLQQAKSKSSVVNNCFVQADINRLPFKREVVDCVISSLALQWSKNTASVMSDVFSCLYDGGRFLFSTLLPGSVVELESASKRLDQAPHVIQFESAQDIERLARLAGFKVENFEIKTYVERFSSRESLLASVKGIGAGNHRSDRSSASMGKEQYRRFLSALDEGADSDGRLSLTYKVLFADLRKPPSEFKLQ